MDKTFKKRCQGCHFYMAEKPELYVYKIHGKHPPEDPKRGRCEKLGNEKVKFDHVCDKYKHRGYTWRPIRSWSSNSGIVPKIAGYN